MMIGGRSSSRMTASILSMIGRVERPDQFAAPRRESGSICEAVAATDHRSTVSSAGVARPTHHGAAHAAGCRCQHAHERTDIGTTVSFRDGHELGKLDRPASSRAGQGSKTQN
jgi:hypothetical protein